MQAQKETICLKQKFILKVLKYCVLCDSPSVDNVLWIALHVLALAASACGSLDVFTSRLHTQNVTILHLSVMDIKQGFAYAIAFQSEQCC